MPISGRVGRHTQMGGKECQNWSEDQQTIIDLLNRITPANGGTGGSLKPRIVKGIVSDALYNAIVTFENKHFPGQRSGYVDPGGRMLQKLGDLAMPAAAAPPAPPPPKAPDDDDEGTPSPDTSTEPRLLKQAEIAMLRPVFRNTFPYDDQQIAANTREWGGDTNSITPNEISLMALSIWRFDFSHASIDDRWIFVHEMTHAWQWYHGRNNVYSALKLIIRYGENYDPAAYIYNFDDGASFFDFNFEQQASITADYWFLTKGKVPKYNKGMRANLETYERYMAEVWGAGLPQREPYRDKSQDWKMQRHTP